MKYPVLLGIYSFTFIEAAALIAIICFSFKKKNQPSVHIGHVFIFALTTMVSYTFSFVFYSITLTKFFLFFYYASITFMMYSLYFFALHFTGFHPKKFHNITCITICTLDVVILFVLTCTQKTGIPNLVPTLYHGKPIYTPSGWIPYFNTHLGISYLFSLGTICVLVYKTCITPQHNRLKYLNVLMVFMALLILNGAVIIFHTIFDFTNLTYGLASILIYYFAFNYKSRNYLLTTTQAVINDSNHLYICFDESHKCIWINTATKIFFSHIPDIPFYLESEFENWRNQSTQFEDFDIDFSENLKVPVGDSKIDLNLNIHKKYDSLGNYLGCWMEIIDITEQIQKEAAFERQLGIDKLTGLPNRYAFFKQVKQLILSRPNTPFLLICSNIVDFKIYNNIFGEEAGNELLKRNSELIQNAHEISLAYGRISGDIFGLIVEEALYNENPLLENMRVMESEFSSGTYHLRMQMSIYKINDPTEQVSKMAEKSILTLKLSKNDFNTKISWFQEDNLNENLNEKRVLGRFEQSLINGEFKMFLQPQVTKDNQVLGAEALARWIDIDGNVITPDRFIPILENNGLVSKLDRFLWEEAAKTLAKWKRMNREDLHISINISVKDFYHENLYDVFTSLVEKYDINPKNLKLEITETAVISDPETINSLLQKLRSYGFEIELDDFGSGYSSLGMLKDITVDALKIDMSFLHRSSTTEDEKSWLILNEIARLASVLNMSTIVEGVEEKEQVDKLSSFGCNVFQGYYFAKPESVISFEERVKLF